MSKPLLSVAGVVAGVLAAVPFLPVHPHQKVCHHSVHFSRSGMSPIQPVGMSATLSQLNFKVTALFLSDCVLVCPFHRWA